MTRRRISALAALLCCAPIVVHAGDIGLTSEGKVPGQPFQALQQQIDQLRQQIQAIQPAPGGGDVGFEFVGVTTSKFPGTAGAGTYSRACHADFPGSRFCTSEEVMKTVNPPALASRAWVHPVLVLGNPAGIVDYSGFAAAGDMSCKGWRSNGERGLTVAGGGSFGIGNCAARSLPATCCAPPARR